jgi:hypothetical protein
MNLGAVMDEIAEVLTAITGLRCFPYPPSTLTPPAAVVTYPTGEGIAYDATYGRGMDRIPDLEVHLVGARVTDRAARELAAQWSAPTGTASVKACLEAHDWVSCDVVNVGSAQFDTVTVGAVDYLDVIFHLDIAGGGT